MGRLRGFSGTGGGAFFGARLIQPGAVAGGGLVTFTRAQVSSVSTATDASGNVVEYAADVPRFNGSAQRLLLGGQRTNSNPNPRAVGSTATSIPTGWAFSSTRGITYTYSRATVNGVAGTIIRGVGTPNSTSGTSLQLEGGETLALGLTVTNSVYVQLISSVGGTPFASFQLRNLSDTASTNITLSGTLQRVTNTVASIGTSYGTRFVYTHVDTTTAIDFELFVGGAQREQDVGFASSLILPTAGTTAASTRGQDNATSAFATLFPSGVGTVLGSFLLPQNAPAGADQVLFDINDGTLNNRIRLRNVAGGATVVAGRTIAGANTDATSLGSMTAGTVFRVGLTFDGATITANLDGGSNQTVAGQPTGLVTLRVGNNSAGTAPMFGEVGYFDVLPYVIPGANLPAAVSAIP